MMATFLRGVTSGIGVGFLAPNYFGVSENATFLMMMFAFMGSIVFELARRAE